MKKSKVIIPAMALLLFSTAASVTGTVAWFTSTRTFTSNAGNFEVGQLDGNLACTVTPGLATEAVEGHADDIKVSDNAILADASYNHTTDKLYTDIAGATDAYQDLGTWTDNGSASTAWKHGDVGTVTYYYAATWKYQFSFTFVAEQSDIDLFFNIAQAEAKITKDKGTTVSESASQPAANTAQGFRIAFVSGTTIGTPGNGVVWAPFQTKANARYISDVDNDPAGTYTADYTEGTGDLLDNTASGQTIFGIASGEGQAPGTKPGTDAANYLGTFAKPESNANQTVTLTIRVTAWFEGTDPSIVTNASTRMQALKVTMPFYVRDAKTNS